MALGANFSASAAGSFGIAVGNHPDGSTWRIIPAGNWETTLITPVIDGIAPMNEDLSRVLEDGACFSAVSVGCRPSLGHVSTGRIFVAYYGGNQTWQSETLHLQNENHSYTGIDE